MTYKEIDYIINSQIKFTKTNSNSVNYRIQILNSLLKTISKNESKIYDALKKWTQYNIKKADDAITSDIENEYLAFNINGVGEIRYKESKMWLWKLNLRVDPT